MVNVVFVNLMREKGIRSNDYLKVFLLQCLIYDIVTSAVLCKKNNMERLTFLFTVYNGCKSREDKTYCLTLVEYEWTCCEMILIRVDFQVSEWTCCEMILMRGDFQVSE